MAVFVTIVLIGMTGPGFAQTDEQLDDALFEQEEDVTDPGAEEGPLRPPDLDDDVDVITVRGQRSEDDTQSQAIAISSFGQEELDQLGVSDLQSLQQNIPSLQIGQSGTSGVVTLRGVGVSNLSLTGEQSVLIVLDGVPLGRPTSALQPFYDVRAVRALRGPQGTAGGKHVTGGTLEIESMPPQPDFAAAGDYQFGSYDQHIWRAYLNAPIFDESLMLRFTGRFEDRSGYQKRIGPKFQGFFPFGLFGTYNESDNYGDAHDLLLRGQARSIVADGLEIHLIGQYSSQEGNGPAIALLGTPNLSTSTGCNVNLNCVPNGGPRFAKVSDDPRETFADYPGFRNDQQAFATAKLKYNFVSDDFGALQLHAQVGYNRDEVDQAFDSDLTFASATVVLPKSLAEQYSGEVILETVDGRPFDWRVGALWWQEFVETDNFVDANGIMTSGDGRIVNELDTRTLSGFFEVDYWLSDRVRLGVGLNYSQDLKEVTAVRTGFNVAGRGIEIPITNEEAFSGFSWKALIDWQATDVNWLGLSVSTGFKAGGFPLGIGCSEDTPCDPFGSEEVTLYELTSRNDFFDERVRLNLTLFWTEYQPYQICLTAGISVNCASNGNATTRGVEVEFSLFPIPQLAIIGNFNLLDARVDNHRIVDSLELRFPTGDPQAPNPLNGFPQDLSGNTIERSPKYNLSARVRYDLELATLGLPNWGTWSPQIQYQYQSRTYYRVFNIKENSQPRFSLINLRGTWRSDSGRWTVESFVDNVTDADVINFLTVGAGPEVRAAYNRPRWAGVRVGFSY